MSVIFFPWRFVRLLLQSVFLALGQIWAHKARAALTTVGILIGVASVTAVIAGLTGFKAKILSDFETIGTRRIGAMPHRPDSGPNKGISWDRLRFYPEQVAGLAERCPSVEAVSRRTWRTTSLRHGSRVVEDVDVIGVDPSWPSIAGRSVIMGRPFSRIDAEESRQVCLLPPKIRDKLLLDNDCTGERILIGDRSFLVIGVIEPPLEFESGLVNMGDDLEMYVPFTTIYSRGAWFSIEAAAKSPELCEEARAEITFFLRGTRKIKPGEPDTFRVMTVQGVLDVFNKIALGITAVTSGIVGISLLVGGVGIMNIMLVSVSERTREIGLRKAVGARPSAILFQFLVEAVILCLLGGLVGLGLGQLMTIGLRSIPGIHLDKASIPMWAVVVSFGFATAVGLFFGMFPAVKAARLDPIEALRHE